MQLWMLGKAKHHLDNHKPDLLFGAQDFIWMAFNHLHEDIKYAFEHRNVFTMCCNKDLQLDGVNEFFFCGKVTIISQRN